MIEEAIYQRLQDLAGGNVFWGVAPENTAPPFVVLTIVSGQHDWALGGATGARSYRAQVDCYAAGHLAARDLAEQAFNLLAPAGDDFGCGPVSDLPIDYDEETGLKRASKDYTIQT